MELFRLFKQIGEDDFQLIAELSGPIENAQLEAQSMIVDEGIYHIEIEDCLKGNTTIKAVNALD